MHYQDPSARSAHHPLNGRHRPRFWLDATLGFYGRSINPAKRFLLEWWGRWVVHLAAGRGIGLAAEGVPYDSGGGANGCVVRERSERVRHRKESTRAAMR